MSYVAQDINPAGLVYRNARDSQLVVWGTQNLSKMGELLVQLQVASGEPPGPQWRRVPWETMPACDGLLWRVPWATVPRNRDFTPSWPIAFSRRQANGKGGRDGNHSLFLSNATMYTNRLMVLVLYDGSIDLLITAWKPIFLFPDLCHHPASMNVILVKMNNNRAVSVECGPCP